MTKDNNDKILAIDDDSIILRLIEKVLLKHNCTPILANNGRSGLEKAEAYQPRAIILDRRMPEMDGNETLIQLKGNDKTKDIPVIMLTGDDRISDIATSFELGAVEYIIKPFNEGDFVQRLHHVLQKNIENKESMVEESLKNNGPHTQEDLDYFIDKKTLDDIEKLMGDKFPSMIEDYLTTSIQYIEQANNGLANDNAKDIARAIHPLKSSSAALGFTKIAEIASYIEQEIDKIIESDKGNVELLSPKLEELGDVFEKSEHLFKKL